MVGDGQTWNDKKYVRSKECHQGREKTEREKMVKQKAGKGMNKREQQERLLYWKDWVGGGQMRRKNLVKGKDRQEIVKGDRARWN